MPEIPTQLRDEKYRFLLIKDGTKIPLEPNWNLSGNYKWDEKKFLTHKGSWGVVCGFGNLAVIDIDNEELYQKIWLKLPKTFTVLTGSKKWHLYYIIPDLKEKIIINDDKEIHRGEVQFLGSQVVGCGSIHPNGNKYEVYLDLPITEIKKKDLMEILKPFLKTEKSTGNSGLSWDISKVAEKISGLERNEDYLQGEHPMHGSEKGDKGSNFRIDFNKGDGGLWTCYRHHSGGDAVYLIGVLEGIIECSDCKKGFFDEHPEKFQEILKVAGKYGYEIDNSKITKDTTEIKIFLEGTKVLNVKGIVKGIKQDCIFVTIRDGTGTKPHLYYYQDGYYQDGWKAIEDKIKEVLKERWSKKFRDEIVDYIKTENMVDRDDIKWNPYLINCKNKVYDLKTDKLLEHSPEYYFLYKLPWDYNPKATCPKIMNYFNSTLSPEFVKISLEIFGYCLYSEYFIPSIFYLYGTGGNGKGVWSTILLNLLGKENVNATEVHSIFENRFAAASLYGKLINICGEIDRTAFKKTSTIKGLTGGDYIQAEMKNRDPFKFLNRAKIISSCNAMPYCGDYSMGWQDRQYVIPFLKKFRGEESEKQSLGIILSSDKKEMEGLLRISIESLKELIKNKKFSYDGYREMYQESMNSAKNFIEEKIERSSNADDFLTVDEIYEACKDYCDEKRLPTPDKWDIGREMTYQDWHSTTIKGENQKTIKIKRFCKWRED